MLALLTALYETRVRVVCVHGGLSSFRSVLSSPFVELPHDVVVPGVLATGDVSDLVATLSPTPIALDGLVDGSNRRLSANQMREDYATALAAYGNDARAKLRMTAIDSDPETRASGWFLEHLKQR